MEKRSHDLSRIIKKVIISVLVLALVSAAAYLAYLNEMILPEKIKAALVAGLEQSTGCDVSMGGAKIDLFKGLVIKDFVVSDSENKIVTAKSISCRFLIIPLFRKEAVITSVKIDSPQVLLERFPDDSINLVDIFLKKPVSFMDGRFTLTVSRVVVSKGEIVFKDYTFQEPFVKDIKNANIDFRLMLPDKVAFNAEFGIPSQVMTAMKVSGEYGLLKKELSMRIEAKDLCLKDFLKYCDETKFRIPDGRVDAEILFDSRDGIINTDMTISGMDMKFSEGKVRADLDGTITAKAKYNTQNKELIYSGSAVVKNLALHNLEGLDNIYDIRGQAFFSDKTFLFKDITATVLGLPVNATAQIKDLQKPVMNVNASSDANLYLLKDILKNRFSIDMPLQMSGHGRLNLILRYSDPEDKNILVKGSLDMTGAVLTSQYARYPAEDVTGKVDFTQNQLIFKDLKLKYDKKDYALSGTLTNFEKPGVQLELRSDSLSARALFSVNEKSVVLSSLTGRYDDYVFSVQGDIDTSDPKDMKADLGGTVSFQLAENKEPYKSAKDRFKDLKLAGGIKADFTLKGDLNNIQDSIIDAEVRSNDLFINKVEVKNFVSHFTRKRDVYNIEYFKANIYGGTIDGNGLIDLAAKDVPYRVNGEVKGVKIEELKKDAAFKDKDVSGIIHSTFGIKGFSDDVSRLNAWGDVNISKGKLWQLNLFKGMGTLLFRSDYSSVMFEESSCDFVFKDKCFYINDLVMKSSLLNLLGTVRVSEGRAISAYFKTEFTDEGVDAARASNIAGAIERYSVIEVSGTLDEPTYQVKPDLSNVMSDIADNFFSKK